MGAYGTTPATGFKHQSGLDAVDLTATTNGIEVDTRGWDGGWATFYVNVGTPTGAGGEVDIKLQETDVTGFGGTVTDITGATFTKIEVGDSTSFDKTLAGTVQILGRQRFLRAVFTETVAVTACPIACVVVLSQPGESNLQTATYEFTITG